MLDFLYPFRKDLAKNVESFFLGIPILAPQKAVLLKMNSPALSMTPLFPEFFFTLKVGMLAKHRSSLC